MPLRVSALIARVCGRGCVCVRTRVCVCDGFRYEFMGDYMDSFHSYFSLWIIYHHINKMQFQGSCAHGRDRGSREELWLCAKHVAINQNYRLGLEGLAQMYCRCSHWTTLTKFAFQNAYPVPLEHIWVRIGCSGITVLAAGWKEKENETEMETKSVSSSLSPKSAMGNCCSVTVGL